MCFDVMTGFYVPSTPDVPKIVRVVGREVTVTWVPPDSNGGAPIKGYVIAYIATDDSVVQRVTIGAMTTVELKVELTPGRTYVFAVAAENKLGLGDFSQFSEYVKIPKETGNSVLIFCTLFKKNIFQSKKWHQRYWLYITYVLSSFIRSYYCYFYLLIMGVIDESGKPLVPCVHHIQLSSYTVCTLSFFTLCLCVLLTFHNLMFIMTVVLGRLQLLW